MEEQIAHLRAELLHKEQETQRVQLQLVKEKEERERAERKVRCSTPQRGRLQTLNMIVKS